MVDAVIDAAPPAEAVKYLRVALEDAGSPPSWTSAAYRGGGATAGMVRAVRAKAEGGWLEA